MNLNLKNLIVLLVKMGVAGFIIFLLLRFNPIDFSEVKSVLFDYQLIAVLFLLMGFAVFFNTLRWVLLLKAQNVTAENAKAYHYSLVGIFFNFLLPSTVGGDVVKAILAAREWSEKKSKLVLSVFVDRVFGLTVMMSLSLVGFLFNYRAVAEIKHFRSVLSVLLALLFAFGLFLVMSRFFKKINFTSLVLQKLILLFISMSGYFQHKPTVVKCILLSFVSFSLHIILFHMVFAHFNRSLPINVFLLCVPLGTVLMALPISLGGIGVGQAVYFFMFNVFGAGLGQIGFMAVTVMQIVYFFWAIVGAVCFAFVPLKLKEIREVASD